MILYIEPQVMKLQIQHILKMMTMMKIVKFHGTGKIQSPHFQTLVLTAGLAQKMNKRWKTLLLATQYIMISLISEMMYGKLLFWRQDQIYLVITTMNGIGSTGNRLKTVCGTSDGVIA